MLDQDSAGVFPLQIPADDLTSMQVTSWHLQLYFTWFVLFPYIVSLAYPGLFNPRLKNLAILEMSQNQVVDVDCLSF